MTSSTHIVVTAVGAISPLGINSEQTCAALRAGITPVNEHELYECTPLDPEWDESLPMYITYVPTIDQSIEGTERFIQLAIPALAEVFAKAKLQRQSLAKTGLLLALPPVDAGTLPLGLDKHFLPLLRKRTGLGSVKLADAYLRGETGVFTAIETASRLLQSGELEYCVVGGVDSYLMDSRLSLLDKNWRLKSLRNRDGFIPGEAAIMLMLETEDHARSRGATPLAIIHGIGRGQEPETLTSEKSSSGQGLANAIRGALPPDQAVKSVYCDLNGESYYAFEWGLMLSRLGQTFAGLKKLHHPADCIGDVGAAVGGLLVMHAIDEFQKQPQSPRETLVWTAADNGERMALLLAAVPS
jgi:3-oxoacyl-[acyl-carrier-protein] synthase-1